MNRTRSGPMVDGPHLRHSNEIRGGYSADVRMQLHVNGHTFAIAQIGPDFLTLRDPADHPPADAEVSLSIDGRQRRWPVRLPNGVFASKPKTPIALRGSAPDGSTVG